MNYRGEKRFRTSLIFELLFLMLVSSRFFDLIPLQPLLAGGGNVFLMLGTLAVIYMTQLGFQLRSGILKQMKAVWWTLAGVFLSFAAASQFYRQGLFTSFIVCRQYFTLLVFPLLLAVRPTYKEVKLALYAFSWICAFTTGYVTFIDQTLVPTAENMPFIEEGDFVHMVSGLHFIVIAFIFSLYEFRTRMTIKKFVAVILLFAFIFIARNRTFLIASCFIAVLSVVSTRSQRSKLYAYGIIGVVALMVFVTMYSALMSLLDETMTQLNNPDYNRIKSLGYFFSIPNGPLSIFIGNGFISGTVNPIVGDLQKEGIFYSDLGLIGLWHVYGLIPPIVILVNVIKGLSPKHSLEVRGNALLILTCSLTVGYFATIETLTWLCFYLYFLHSDGEYFEAMVQYRKKIQQMALHRYRSLR